jgi:flagellar biosynthesis/type III secretory pathway protein FliH
MVSGGLENLGPLEGAGMELILRTPELAQDRRTLRPARLPQGHDPREQAAQPQALGTPDVAPAGAPLPLPDGAPDADVQAPDTVMESEATRQERELHAAYLEAGRRGYAEGYEQGQAAAAEEAGQRIERMEAMLGALENVRKDLMESAEDDMVALVFEMLTGLLGTQLVTREGILAHVRSTIDSAHGDDTVVVRLHPADLALIEDAPGETGGEAPRGAVQRSSLGWKADESLTQGGCVIESSAGLLEARLDRQLHALLEALASARRARRAQAEARP